MATVATSLPIFLSLCLVADSRGMASRRYWADIYWADVYSFTEMTFAHARRSFLRS